MSNFWRIRAALLVTLLGAYCGAALAHHSPIVFDRTRKITVEGVVTEFKWSSPHSWIHLDVKDASGNVANWGIEMNPASVLARSGWRATTIKPGDKVSITVYPLRNDEKGGQYISIKLPDGSTLGERPDGVL
jgi:Family of unknown function (DUF6152)